ncbi:UDP-N-acetylmuramate dehydrogenase [Patescibacteria group bacterium]|nr:UDP-N-acetylmuramate dehydrogenase [Patescibacteria group bacterium]
MKIQKNISLKEYTTFKVGGEAKYFAVINGIEDLKQAVNFAKQNSLPVFVLGGGSNLLISDEGVDGLVLKMEIKGTDFASQNPSSQAERDNSGIVQVTAGAGEIWDNLVEKCVEKGLSGLENLSLIPGTVGASAVQNIGAYGIEACDVINWVEVFDIKTGEIKKLTGVFCKFNYRDSIFKKEEGKDLIVTRVAYNLQKEGELKMDYKDIQEYFDKHNFKKEQATLKQLRNAIIEIRKSKLPNCEKVGTAGSYFKNPTIAKKQLDKLLQKYPELPHYESGQQFKIPLAYVLDKILGLKGFKEGCAGLYENQPLVLVNYGKSDCKNIKNLAQKIQKEVKDKTGLDIDSEVVEW